MNEKDITRKVIKNSKIIHKHVGRFKIERGDWILYDSSGSAVKNVTSDARADWANQVKSIPIWTARKCKEWLRKRGYGYHGSLHIGKFTRDHYVFYSSETSTWCTAPTEDRACQMAEIKVLKNGKEEK